MTRSTDSTPDVPLPLGAVPPNDVVRGWADYDNEFRIVYGDKHVLHTETQPDDEVSVEACAVQMADGTIQPRNLTAIESGPTVSVQCHWENYLTADEARLLAKHIEESADTVDQWANPARHVCPFDWCEITWHDDREHWSMIYTRSSLRYGDPLVGIGVTYDEGMLPCVVVHLDGGRREVDENTHLTIPEAEALHDQLERSIAAAKSASIHMAQQMLAEHG